MQHLKLACEGMSLEQRQDSCDSGINTIIKILFLKLYLSFENCLSYTDSSKILIFKEFW